MKLLYQKIFQRFPKTEELVDTLKYINAVPAGQREQAFVEVAQVLFEQRIPVSGLAIFQSGTDGFWCEGSVYSVHGRAGHEAVGQFVFGKLLETFREAARLMDFPSSLKA